MAIREVDAISDAIISTEKEIAGDAWGNEATDALDQSGDRSLEDIGGGLEGQHEADDDDTDGEDAEGEGSEAQDDGEGEGEVAAGAEALVAGAKEGTGEQLAAKPGARTEPEGGRVPSGILREANERARVAESKLDEVTKTFGEKLDQALREISELRRAPARTEPPKPAETEVKADPDIFEDPKGFVSGIKQEIQTGLNQVLSTVRQNSVSMSFELAHVRHGEAFPKAMEAINKLDAGNPDDRVIVQRIYNSPNPGEALVTWHKRQQTLSEVGDDPAAYREKVAKETREALIKDPEFRKQLLADLRGEALAGDDGTPRTANRLPRSLARAPGSNLGAERMDPRVSDDSEQAVAESAWR